MWGAGPPATWAFAIFLASDMLFLRLFPGGFGVFAFSQCEEAARPYMGDTYPLYLVQGLIQTVSTVSGRDTVDTVCIVSQRIWTGV